LTPDSLEISFIGGEALSRGSLRFDSAFIVVGLVFTTWGILDAQDGSFFVRADVDAHGIGTRGDYLLVTDFVQ
jgi:hypothetical protein